MQIMYTLVLIGLLGGLITGISPCILPVLPVIFFSGAQSARDDGTVKTKRALSETLRPYRVIAGLVLSFSVVTLVGSALLSLLHLLAGKQQSAANALLWKLVERATQE